VTTSVGFIQQITCQIVAHGVRYTIINNGSQLAEPVVSVRDAWCAVCVGDLGKTAGQILL